MSGPTAEQIAQRAFDMGLLNEMQLQEVWGSLGSTTAATDDFLQAVVRRGMLTNYQVERLVKGERSGFFFGDFKVLYLVGTGTFARVYRAVHRESGQIVAIKVLRKRFSDDPDQFTLFIREGELGRTLRHPNIVPIYEVSSHRYTHYLVMEFVEGRNLREFVKVRKKMEPMESTRLMIDICSGLQYAFERGLTHRDLKMSNVLVSSRGQAKLVDFGLAALDEAIADEDQADAPTTRTIDYAALERATGVRSNDTRSDIYFSGCMFYHMLVGRSPLGEVKDRVQRLSKSRFTDVVPIQKAAPELARALTIVCNKAMALDPSRRYQTPGEMLAELEIAARRLTEGPKKDESPEAARERERLAAMLTPGEQRSVMVVEPNSRMQDLFREGLRKAGFRVLLTTDPERACERLRQETKTADCVVFDGQEIGEAALAGFNRLGSDPSTHQVPAVLLLEKNQRDLMEQAQTSEHRKILSMPVTLGQLRAVLEKLTASPAGAAPGA